MVITIVLAISTSIIKVWIQAGPVVAMKVTQRRGLILFLAKVKRASSGLRCRTRHNIFVTFSFLLHLYSYYIFCFRWSSLHFLGNIAPADREVGRTFDPVLVWKSTAGDSKEELFFFHTWCAAGAIYYWDIILEKKLILMTSVAVWGSKQHNSEGTIRGKRHSWLRGFPKTGYYGEYPLPGARCWCWWWSWYIYYDEVCVCL